MIVSVTGMLMVFVIHLVIMCGIHVVLGQIDDSPNPLQFSQVFQLIPDGGSYYV